MADFNIAYSIVADIEGGYQSNPSDDGNYCNGDLIGTNHGISAGTMADSLLGGRCPSVDEMLALTSDQAKSVYDVKFWNAIRGNEITNQNTANMLFDMYVNQTGFFNSIIQNAVIKQRLFLSTFDRPFSDSELNLLNSLDQQLLFEDIKAGREDKYRYLAATQPAKAQFLNGWLARLDRLEWNLKWRKPLAFGIVAVAILLVGIGVYLYIVNRNKIKL